MYDALSTKELDKRANDTSLTPELRLAAARELTRRSNLRKDDVSRWKRKLGIGLFLLAGLTLYGHADAMMGGVIGSTVAGLDQVQQETNQREAACPTPTSANSGWVGEDANNDGYTDHIWRVYTSGKCAGQAVDQTGTAEIIASFNPQ